VHVDFRAPRISISTPPERSPGSISSNQLEGRRRAHLGLEDRGALQQRALSDRAIGKIAEALNVSLATVGNDLAPELSPTDNSGAAQEKPGPREKLTWKQKAHPAPCGGARGSQRGGRIRTSTSTTLNSTGTPYAAKSLASACNSRWLSDSQLSGMTRKILRG